MENDLELYSYFVVRLRHGRSSEAAPWTGVVERLGAGEKCAFSGPDQLVQLLLRWSRPDASIAEAPPTEQPR
jgi:hypothetical protein